MPDLRHTRRVLPMAATCVLVAAAGVVAVLARGHDVGLQSIGCADTPYRATDPVSSLFIDSRNFLDPGRSVLRMNVNESSAVRRLHMPGRGAFSGARQVFLADVAAAPTSPAIAAWYEVYPSDTRQPSSDRLVVVRNGRIQQQIFSTGPGFQQPPGLAWSSDGRALFFSVFNSVFEEAHPHTFHHRLYVATFNRAGSVAKISPVPGGVGLIEPTVSPDGRRVAAIAVRYVTPSASSESRELVTVNVRSGVRHTLLRGSIQGHKVGLEQPAWSPDGASIAVVRPRLDFTFPRKHNSGDDILLVDARPSGPRESPMVIVSGQGEYALGTPQWLSVDELWFSSAFDVFSSGSDDDPPPMPSDVCSVRRTLNGGFSDPVDVTRTTKRSEVRITFSR